MRAAIFHGPGRALTVEDVAIGRPEANEVLVRTVACGVCGSDRHPIDGDNPLAAPAVLGHEAAGIVEEVGDRAGDFVPGDHVIACLAVFCGRCQQCFSGHPGFCTNKAATQRRSGESPRLALKGSPLGQFLDIGGFAEKILVHESALVKIDNDVPLDRAALIGCGVTTGVGAVINTAQVRPGSTVAVFGAGGVGLAAIQGSRIVGARQIIAVDVHESKLAAAMRAGATHTVDASSGDPVAMIMNLTGTGVDYSFEVVGTKRTAEQAFASLAPRGTATIVGILPAGHKIETDGLALILERKLQGSKMGSNRSRIDMPLYVDYYMGGRLNLDDLITRRAHLDEINDAFRAMKVGEVSRTVLMFD